MVTILFIRVSGKNNRYKMIDSCGVNSPINLLKNRLLEPRFGFESLLASRGWQKMPLG